MADPPKVLATLDHAFLPHGSVLADLVRSFDWASTSLGPISAWPTVLRTTLGMLLRSRHPMFLWWGRDLIQFYNDAYLPSFGVGKHPAALGQRGEECWGETWPLLSPQVDAVMLRGESSWNEDALVPILRNGRMEEVYWTYGYLPLVGDEGEVLGTLVVCNENTSRVLAERRLGTIRTLVHRLDGCVDLAAVIDAASAVVATAPHDIPFFLAYRRDDLAGLVRIEPTKSTLGPLFDSVDAIARAHLADGALEDAVLVELEGASRSVALPGSLPPEPPSQVFLAPLDEQSDISLAFGLSPRLPFDAPYREFVGLFVEQIDRAIARGKTLQLQSTYAAERRNLLLQAPMPTALLMGPDHVFELANASYEQMVGRKVIGKTYLEAFPELIETALPSVLDEVYRTGEPFVAPESLVRLDRDGDGALEDGFFKFSLEPLRDANGKVYGMIAVAFDLTEQVIARRKLETAMAEALG